MALSYMPTYLRGLVGEQCVLSGLLAIGTGLELSQVAVVISLHLEVEDLRLAARCRGDQMLVEQGEDAGTDVTQLLLNLHVQCIREAL